MSIQPEDIIEIVTLLDENGEEVTFDHLLTFTHLDNTYIALMPIDDVEGLDADEVLLLEVTTDEQGEDRYTPVENEVLLEEVFETFLELFDEYILEEEEEE